MVASVIHAWNITMTLITGQLVRETAMQAGGALVIIVVRII